MEQQLEIVKEAIASKFEISFYEVGSALVARLEKGGYVSKVSTLSSDVMFFSSMRGHTEEIIQRQRQRWWEFCERIRKAMHDHDKAIAPPDKLRDTNERRNHLIAMDAFPSRAKKKIEDYLMPFLLQCKQCLREQTVKLFTFSLNADEIMAECRYCFEHTGHGMTPHENLTHIPTKDKESALDYMKHNGTAYGWKGWIGAKR